MKQTAYDKLDHRHGVLRDRVRAVAMKQANGFYLFGRPGTSKTFTVRRTLDELASPYYYHSGRITPMGLFDVLRERPDELVVLDDVGTLFDQRPALELLLAALGNQPNETTPRMIRYRRQGRDEAVQFSGGIIAISNLTMQGTPMHQALDSRMHVMHYDPSDEEIAALMVHVTAGGWDRTKVPLTTAECDEVTRHVIEEASRMRARLDMRVLLDKALPDYAMWKQTMTETHWKDLVTATLEGKLGELRHTPPRTRTERKNSEHEIVKRLRAENANTREQLERWEEETGKSQRAFWRRLREIEGDDEQLTE